MRFLIKNIFKFNLLRSSILLPILAGLIHISSCQNKPVALMNAPLDVGKKSPIPPSQEELLTSRSYIAFIPVQFSGNLSRYHKALSVSFVQSVLEEHGDLKIIDDVRVQRAINRSQFDQLRTSLEKSKLRSFEESLIKQSVELGKWLRVRYIVLMRVQPSPEKVSLNDWSTYIRFMIIRVEEPVKNEMTHEFTFVFSESNDIWEELGNLVRGKFPLGGYIIESRANSAYVSINLGRVNRVFVDQECKIYRRVKKENKLKNGKNIFSIEYDKIGKLTLFRVQNDFAWGRVPSNFRDSILVGDVVRCY